MLDHRVLPVDECREVVVFPDERALIPFLRLLQHKTEPGIIALVFDTGEAPPPTFEANAAGLSQTDARECAVGSTYQRLGEDGVKVLSDPADTQLFGCFISRR